MIFDFLFWPPIKLPPLTWQRGGLRGVVIPFVNGEILVDGNGDDGRILNGRVRIARNVRDG